MSPNLMVPAVGSCSVATVRIRVDLPAPFGPSSPYMPRGIERLTLSRATVPLAYVCDRFEISSIHNPQRWWASGKEAPSFQQHRLRPVDERHSVDPAGSDCAANSHVNQRPISITLQSVVAV